MNRYIASIMAMVLSISPAALTREALPQPKELDGCANSLMIGANLTDHKRPRNKMDLKRDQQYAAKAAFTFNAFVNGYIDFAKEAFPGDKEKQKKFFDTLGPRAALRTIAAMIEDLDPAFSSDDVVIELMEPQPDLEEIGETLIIKLLKCI